MRFKRTAAMLLIIMISGVCFWYINFPMYEKKAEERIQQYIEAQGIDESKLSNENSFKNWTQGRWHMYYQYEYEGVEEYEIAYRYTYDRSRDQVDLTIVDRGVPLELVPSEIGGKIDDYSDFPPVLNSGDWTGFDSKGNIILKQNDVN